MILSQIATKVVAHIKAALGPKPTPPTCRWCKGDGCITAYAPWSVWNVECPRCKGTGKLEKQLTNFYWGHTDNVGWNDPIKWAICPECDDETPHILFRVSDSKECEAEDYSIAGEDVCDECGHSRLIYR